MHTRFLLVSVVVLTGCAGNSSPTLTDVRLVAHDRVARTIAERPPVVTTAPTLTLTHAATPRTVTTAFDGRTLAVTLTPDPGPAVTLTTDRHRVDDPLSRPQPAGRRPGRAQREETLLLSTSTRTTMVQAMDRWAETDPTDYLAAGRWVQLDGPLGDTTGPLADVGAFVAGPEFATPRPCRSKARPPIVARPPACSRPIMDRSGKRCRYPPRSPRICRRTAVPKWASFAPPLT